MTDIVDRLRTVASSADHLWLADLLSEAADRIEAMRKDMETLLRVATVGPGFAEITKDVRHGAPE